MESLYRFSDPDGTLLYVGISGDWSRRIREHARDKPWFGEIAAVTLENFASRLAVEDAERTAIRGERPLYNVQHNRPDSQMPGGAEVSEWTIADVIVVGIIAIAVVWIAWQVSVEAIEKYKAWKADREEFRTWQRSKLEATTADDTAHEPAPFAPVSVLWTPRASEPNPEVG